MNTYVHPFGIAFPTTTRGNRGPYQQIVQVKKPQGQCGGSRGEMIFPLGQSGFIPFAKTVFYKLLQGIQGLCGH